MLESLKSLPANLVPALTELQGLKMAVLSGVAANTAISVPTIRKEDTVIGAVSVTATTAALTDQSSAVTVQDLRASGTLTFASAVANDTFTVRGKVYTLKATPASGTTYEVKLGASDTETAANVAAAINQYDGNSVTATSALGVVTITANVEGTAGNAYTLVGGTRITASAATMADGSATGSIKISNNTTGMQIVLLWLNKK